ncbi:uncharacterized protein LOC119464742 [Dermacentor silvarum]|uniref:uncharacterized protein LOC119464742 n=1 Tax=Dermacentor silvarum TaxID=543639 RepID=UPI001898203D|nr:uncharacterized protein LOC119464742 [Dermacentor silvarum]
MASFPEFPLPGNESLNDVVRDLLSGNKSLSQIQVNSEYVITWNGFFNIIEVVLAASLFLVVNVMAGGDSTLRCLATVAFAMAVQGVHFLLCGLFSPVVTISIASSVYYVSFHIMAIFFFFGPGFCSLLSLHVSILECAGGIIAAITAVVLACVHLVHAIYCLTGSVTRHHNINIADLRNTFSDLVH